MTGEILKWNNASELSISLLLLVIMLTNVLMRKNMVRVCMTGYD